MRYIVIALMAAAALVATSYGVATKPAPKPDLSPAFCFVPFGDSPTDHTGVMSDTMSQTCRTQRRERSA